MQSIAERKRWFVLRTDRSGQKGLVRDGAFMS